MRDRIAASAVGKVDKSTLDQAAVQGMLGALHDKWANYLTPEQYAGFEQNLDGRFSGVGLWLRQDASALAVSQVQTHSPASEAGVKVGQQLVSVAGKSTRTMSIAAAAAALRGTSGTHVAVVLRSGKVTTTLDLVRRALPSDDVTVDKLTAHVGRITIGAFTRGVGLQVRNGLAELRAEHVSGVVLDLRDNPGGLLDEAVRGRFGAASRRPPGRVVPEQGRRPDRAQGERQRAATRSPRWRCWSTAARRVRPRSSPARCRTASAPCGRQPHVRQGHRPAADAAGRRLGDGAHHRQLPDSRRAHSRRHRARPRTSRSP